MAKDKIMYVCEHCGQESVQWIGKCPACGSWNSFKEIRVAPSSRSQNSQPVTGTRKTEQKAKLLKDVPIARLTRIDTEDTEFNRVLGGGIVPGSLNLLGGEPGIGKSTLLLQLIMRLKDLKVLYVSGEESESQVKLRAERMCEGNQQMSLDHCYILCENSLESVFEQARSLMPQLMIVDSVQAISSEQGEAFPGSPSQVRACTVQLLRFAKDTGIPVFLVGHITKDGTLAGPKILEHIVDTVLQFEGDRKHFYRVLRGLKNRFGSTDELGIYEMSGAGLIPVVNPSDMLLNKENEGMSGISVASAIEGARPLLIETQALVSTAAYGTPQRSATGFDLRRLNMLLAVLEKRANFRLAQKDVFLNIAGGLKVSDTAIELSVIMSVLSSHADFPVPPSTCMAGEVGLSGEIRPVTHIAQRIAEAGRQGFSRFVLPRMNMRGLDAQRFNLQLIPVSNVKEALKSLFGNPS